MDENYLKQLRILLADDDGFLRQLHLQVFRQITEEKILRAENGQEALDMLSNKPIDVLVTDIEMPKINGLELIKKIRCGETGASNALPIIVISNFANKEVLTSCLALEINGFLAKPISRQAAVDKLKIAMKERFALKNDDAYQHVETDLGKLIDKPGDKKSAEQEGESIAIYDLREGMVLSAHLRSFDGSLLLNKGHKLTESMIRRIDEMTPIIDQTSLRVYAMI